MNILITGSNGFVGSALMWRLEYEGHSVIGIDRSVHCEEDSHPHTHYGDIRYLASWQKFHASHIDKLLPGIDLIIHCAAAKHDFGISREEYFSHNELGTKTLLTYMESYKINRLIFFSTVSVYGHPDQRTDETGAYLPDNDYGASKLAGDTLCRLWQQKQPDRELLILRPTIIYGPYNYTNLYNMLHYMHICPLLTIGRGDYIKSIVSRANILDMTCFALGRLQPGVTIYNCVDKPYITVNQLMQLISRNPAFRMPSIQIPVAVAIAIGKVFDVPVKLLKLDLPINSERMRKLATPTDVASERIRQDGYIQQHTIEEEITTMTAWYLTRKKRSI